MQEIIRSFNKVVFVRSLQKFSIEVQADDLIPPMRVQAQALMKRQASGRLLNY